MTSATRYRRIDHRLPAVARSVPALRRAAVAFAEEEGLPDVQAVALAVTEGVTNAVVHAYTETPDAPGEVRLVCCAEDDRVVIVVRDWGHGMRPRADSPGLGLGLPTMAHLASEFRVEAPEGPGTLLRMHFSRFPADDDD